MNSFIIRYRLLFFLALALLSSCSSVQHITIELPQKAEKELPQNIQSLLLVNRTVDSTYTNLSTDSLQNIFFAKKFDLDTVINDLQSADTLLKVTSDLLFESGRYDIVIPEDRFIAHQKNAFLTKPLPWDDARQLCEAFNTDAVLSVDMFKTHVATKYTKERYFNPMENTGYVLSVAKMGIVYEALFRVYDPASEKVLVREFMRDTLIWDNMAGSARELFRNFTPVKQALSEASIALALDFTEKIGPTWVPDERDIFISGGDAMKQAGRLVDSGDWESAEKIWKNVVKGKASKNRQSKALFNLAVVAELNGDIDLAIKLALKSYETMYQQLTYDYLKRLKLRKQEMEK